MPYIEAAARQRYQAYETSPLPQTPGDLNYCITRICDRVLGATPNYDNMSAVVGVLECVRSELVRRLLDPYEDTKMAERGDVYRPRPWMGGVS